MNPRTSDEGPALNLRPGAMVQVRSRSEILATLDASGTKDALPFMPEMLQYCGRQFRVYKRADKTCDTIRRPTSLRMENAVHLDNVRCDGAAHGGCQASCLIFWKESWLKPVAAPEATPSIVNTGEPVAIAVTPACESQTSLCTEETLFRACRRPATEANSVQEEAFSCQATELPNATTSLAWWDVRQYVRDITSGNIRLSMFVRSISISLLNILIRSVRRCIVAVGHRLVGWRVNPAAASSSGNPRAGASGDLSPRSALVEYMKATIDTLLVEYPHIRGTLSKTPSTVLNLQPGEFVHVKTLEEIVATLDVNNRNRGLLFDVEMVPYCGGTYRVLRRVERILNEKTGRIVTLPNSCVILEDVVCRGCVSRHRLFCPRSIYSYWRDIWLERAE